MFDKTHVEATAEDTEKILRLLNTSPYSVIVRDVNQINYLHLFTDYAEGPFLLKKEGGYFYISGKDKKTGEQKDLRIIKSEGPFVNVVQLRDQKTDKWISPGFGSVRLYIPKDA